MEIMILRGKKQMLKLFMCLRTGNKWG